MPKSNINPLRVTGVITLPFLGEQDGRRVLNCFRIAVFFNLETNIKILSFNKWTKILFSKVKRSNDKMNCYLSVKVTEWRLKFDREMVRMKTESHGKWVWEGRLELNRVVFMEMRAQEIVLGWEERRERRSSQDGRGALGQLPASSSPSPIPGSWVPPTHHPHSWTCPEPEANLLSSLKAP